GATTPVPAGGSGAGGGPAARPSAARLPRGAALVGHWWGSSSTTSAPVHWLALAETTITGMGTGVRRRRPLPPSQPSPSTVPWSLQEVTDRTNPHAGHAYRHLTGPA